MAPSIAIRKQGTVRYGEEIPVLAMLPVRVRVRKNGEPVLWLPEEATKVYARAVHRASGMDVARGDLTYYHNGHSQAGRSNYRWSLSLENLPAIEFLGWSE